MTAWAERLADRSPIVQRSRDRSVQQARVLIDAARRLVAEKGENFTTHELVKEAGVALQTFYRYFAGKDELLLAVIDAPTTVALIGRHRAIAGGGRDFEQNLLQEVRSMLQQVVDTAARSGVRARGHVTVSEEVEEQILKEALVQQVDLILVRSRGQTGIMKALLGSTAGQILEAAPCPVLVARV